MQNINKELSLCSQLGTDAQPEACRCLSAIRPHGGPRFKECKRACKAVMFFTSENKSLEGRRATFASEEPCQTFFFFFYSQFRTAGYEGLIKGK